MDAEGMLVAKNGSGADTFLLPAMANRHGLVAGATGTGKTVTLQVLAEAFSSIGVPVFAADVKGDLSGVSQVGGGNARVDARIAELGLGDWGFHGSPVVFWDVFGQQGHPVRTTMSEIGPVLLSRLLDLNDIQEGVLNVVFRVADDNGLLLLDLKDLRAMLQYVSEHSAELTTTYGNVSAASIGTIQRSLLTLENQGGGELFGEPALDLMDLIQTTDGKGVINLLASDRLMQSPRVYSTFLLWMLSELFEQLPEAGDLAKPRLVFFFDEAHLLFDSAPPALLQKIEQVVRLIRSKGVGVYFVTQNPIDIPDDVLGQLGNKVQHALRAFTPREQKAVKAMAETFRQNPGVDVETVVTELVVGEALISLLQSDGSPMPVERARVVPPHGRIGTISAEERAAVIAGSVLVGHYEAEVDSVSAYETLAQRAQQEVAAAQEAVAATAAAATAVAQAEAAQEASRPVPPRGGYQTSPPPRGRQREGIFEAMGKSAARAMSSQIGREIARGILGTVIGGLGRKR